MKKLMIKVLVLFLALNSYLITPVSAEDSTGNEPEVSEPIVIESGNVNETVEFFLDNQGLIVFDGEGEVDKVIEEYCVNYSTITKIYLESGISNVVDNAFLVLGEDTLFEISENNEYLQIIDNQIQKKEDLNQNNNNPNLLGELGPSNGDLLPYPEDLTVSEDITNGDIIIHTDNINYLTSLMIVQPDGAPVSYFEIFTDQSSSFSFRNFTSNSLDIIQLHSYNGNAVLCYSDIAYHNITTGSKEIRIVVEGYETYEDTIVLSHTSNPLPADLSVSEDSTGNIIVSTTDTTYLNKLITVCTTYPSANYIVISSSDGTNYMYYNGFSGSTELTKSGNTVKLKNQSILNNWIGNGQKDISIHVDGYSTYGGTITLQHACAPAPNYEDNYIDVYFDSTSGLTIEIYECDDWVNKFEQSAQLFLYPSSEYKIDELQYLIYNLNPKITRGWWGTITISTKRLSDFNVENGNYYIKIAVPGYECYYADSVDINYTDDDVFWSSLDKNTKSIVIPEGIVSIPGNALDEFRKLESITIPSTLTDLGGHCFVDCPNLATIKVNENNPVFYSENNAIITKADHVLIVGSKNTTAIPSSVAIIGGSSFEGRGGLTSVTIPSSVQEIQGYAFFRCYGLKTVSIPNSVIIIEDKAFNGCSNLTSIYIPRLSVIGDRVFGDCKKLETVTFSPDYSLTTIGKGTFYNCSNLTTINIPSSVSSIKNNTFEKCTGLTTINIPSFITSIGDEAFLKCNNLTSITIPSSVISIGDDVFYGCNNLESITVDQANDIYESNNSNAIIEKETNALLFGCKNTVIPNTVTEISEHAFYGCKDLTSITIPSSVETIGERAFMNCTGLTSITIPANATIYDHAFAYCDNLISVYIPSTASIPSPSGWSGSKSPFAFSYYVEFYTDATSKPAGWINEWSCLYDDYYTDDRDVYAHVYWDVSLDDFNTKYSNDSIQAVPVDLAISYDADGNLIVLTEDNDYLDALLTGTGYIDIYNGKFITGSASSAINPEGYDNITRVLLEGRISQEDDGVLIDFNGIDLSGYDQGSLIFSIGIKGYERSYIKNKQRYSIKYYYNHGNGDPAEKNSFYYKGEGLSSLFNPEVPTHYVFDGWYTLDGTTTGKWGTKVTSVPKTAVKDYVLYAKYTRISATITFDKNGATSGTMPAQVIYAGDTNTLNANTFVKTGYTFAGWIVKGTQDEYNDGDVIDNSLLVHNAKYTFVAQWTPNTYTVVLSDGLDAQNNTTVDLEYNESYTLTNNFSNPGFKFNGWTGIVNGKVVNYKNGQTVKNLTSEKDATITLQAKWVATTYSIKYNLYKGSNPKGTKTSYYYGEAYVLPIPTKKGYLFNRWETASGETIADTDGKEENLVLYANWSVDENIYTITYDDDSVTNKISYTVNDSFTINNPLNRDGYKFLGWYDESGKKVTKIVKGSAGDLNLTARFEPIKYNVVFNANGGKGKMDKLSITYSDNPSFTLLPNAYTKPGYKFVGWTIDKRNPIVNYGNNETITSNLMNKVGAFTLYAIWQPDTEYYTYIYKELNGGSLPQGVNTTPYSYTPQDSTINLVIPTKDGYKFMGWYDQNGNKITSIVKGSQFNYKLTAQWTDLSTPSSITYQPNGGIVQGDNYTQYISGVSSFTLNKVVKNGYKFLGWYVVVIDDQASEVVTNIKMTKITKTTAGDLKLRAMFEPIKYNLSFNANGGKGKMTAIKNIEYNENGNFTLPNNVFTRDGYDFIGWSFDKKSTTADFDNSGSFNYNTKEKSGTYTLYAIWKPHTYKVVYKAGLLDVNGSMSDQVITYNIQTPLTNVAYSKNGYKFDGWTGIVNGKVVNYKNGAKVKNLSSVDNTEITLTAKWIATASYKIKYNLNNGAFPKGVNARTTYFNETYTLPIPTKKGYTFAGWYKTSDFSGSAITSTENQCEDLVLYAKWS